MNLSEKKYFSIAEVSEITGLSKNKLRYLEKAKKISGVVQVRRRRYYTSENIKFIQQKFSEQNQLQEDVLFSLCSTSNVTKIDNLIYKFTKLEKEIKEEPCLL